MGDGFFEFKSVSAKVAYINNGVSEFFWDFLGFTQDWHKILEVRFCQKDISKIFAVNKIVLNKLFSGLEQENSVGEWSAQGITSGDLKSRWGWLKVTWSL